MLLFVRVRLDSGYVEIKHRTTDEIMGNLFTKLLQGNKCQHFKAIIMGELMLPDYK